MLSDITLQLLGRPSYARASDYFGFWGMEDCGFSGLTATIAQLDIEAHELAAKLSPEEKRELAKAAIAQEVATLSELFGIEFYASESGLMVGKNGLAVVPLNGTLMKAQSSLGAGTSTVDARRKVRAAMSDPAVTAALFRVDSPGGTVAGTQEFADDIARLQAMKPTAAQIEDLGASAAYWPISQTGLIGMNSAGMAGSIGVLNAVTDSSGRNADMKIKVHVIRTGKHKGIGMPGAEVTAEQLAHLQERADAMHDLFAGAVAKGRRMTADAVAEVADGSVFVGQRAKDVGLVDAIQSMDDTVAQLMERAKPKAQVSVLKGLDEMTEPKAATLTELKAKFSKSTAEWREKQMEASATLAQAAESYSDFLQAQLDASEERNAKLKEETAAAVAAGKKRGLDPFTSKEKEDSDAQTFDDPKAEFLKVRTEYMEKHKCGAIQAGAAISKLNPALHVAYVASTQSSKGAKQNVLDQYEELT